MSDNLPMSEPKLWAITTKVGLFLSWNLLFKAFKRPEKAKAFGILQETALKKKENLQDLFYDVKNIVNYWFNGPNVFVCFNILV